MSTQEGEERSIGLRRREGGGYSYIEICDPTPEVLDALRSVGENDPATYLDWNLDKLSDATAWANQNRPPLPPWYTAGQYPITAAGIRASLVGCLAQSGSGHQLVGALLAPNDLAQASRIQQKIRQLMLVDPFLLAVCADHRCPLARVYVLADESNKLTGVHWPMLPLPQGVGVEAFE